MKIYNKSGVEITDLKVTDNSYRYREIMSSAELTLYFSLNEFIDIPVDSYADFQGERYTLLKPQNFKKNSSRDFEYTLILESAKSLLSRYKLKDIPSKRLKFPLTAKPQEHLQMLVDNLNQRDSGWTVGDCVESAEKVISYNHTYCDDALRMIAEAFNTEFEIVGKRISIKKVEYNKTAPLSLSYGLGNGFKTGVKRENSGNSKAIEVLYVQGGERNIDFSKYGSKELLLPVDQRLKFDGTYFEGEAGFNAAASREYISDGYSIQRYNKPLDSHIEDSLDCSHIYPSRVGTISSVVVVDAGKNFYDFTDISIPENLNFEDCLIAGEKMTVVFQSNMLAGKEFDVAYNHAARRFEIVPQEIDGVTMPNETFKPAIGDKYAVFGISLPSAYVCDNATKTGASWDMFRDGVKYFYENEDPRFSFTGELDEIWAKTNWVNIGGKIILGGFISFTDEQFQNDPVLIRIVGIKDFINNPYSPQIELSNVTAGGTTSSLIKDIPLTEVVIDTAKKEVIRYAKRGFRDAKQTTEMLQSAMLNFSSSISPLTVQTMQLIAGDESLQFEFVANSGSTVAVAHAETFNPGTKQFSSAAGVLQHKTLGITSISSSHSAAEYKWWSMDAFTSAVLDESDKSYYLYAKVSKTTNTGAFLLSETPIASESVAGFYHLLMGILNSEFDGDRAYSAMYGYSELTPGRLTTKKIVSPDGQTFFDLENGVIQGSLKFQSGVRVEDDALAKANAAQAAAAADATAKVAAVKIGGENLVAGSILGNVTRQWLYVEASKGLKDGDTITVQIWGTGQVDLDCYKDNGYGLGAYITANGYGVATYDVKPFTNSQYNNGNILFIATGTAVKIKVERGNKATDYSRADEDIQAEIDIAKASAQESIDFIDNILPAQISSLQAQIDGVVDSFYYAYTPTLANEPASLWTTEELKARHVGDTFTNTQPFIDESTTPDAGKSWRFVNTSGVYSWTPIADSDAVKALLAASKAQDTADGKRRSFVAQPTTPYEVGDLWVQGGSGDLMRCVASRLSGSFNSADWEKAVKYTDDVAANAYALAKANLAEVTAKAYADGIVTTEESRAIADATAKANTAQAAAAADATAKVNAVQIGARNLFSGTNKNYECIAVWGGWAINAEKQIFINNSYYNAIRSVNIDCTTNKNYILSFNAIVSTTQYRIEVENPTTAIGIINLAVKNGMNTVSIVIPEGNNSFRINYYGYNQASGYCKIYNIKLEIGNKATDWTPAPEDVEAEINIAKAAANAAKSITDNFTTIDGGVVTSNLMQVGSEAAGVAAGMTGVGAGAEQVRFWAGSTHANRATAPYRVLQDGSVVMSKATVEGIIKAISGEVGGFAIATGRIGVTEDTSGLSLLADFIKFYDSTSGVWVGIGENVLPASSGIRALGRFENREQKGYYANRTRTDTYWSESEWIAAGSPQPAQFYYDFESNLDKIEVTVSYQEWVVTPGTVNYGILFDVEGAEENIAIDIDSGKIKARNGGVISWDSDYMGQAFPDALEANIGKTNQFIFTTVSTSLLNVRLPASSFITAHTSGNVSFILTIVIAHYVNNAIRLSSVSNGQIYDNNGNAVSYIDMGRGDTLTLRYYSGAYYIMSQRN